MPPTLAQPQAATGGNKSGQSNHETAKRDREIDRRPGIETHRLGGDRCRAGMRNVQRCRVQIDPLFDSQREHRRGRHRGWRRKGRRAARSGTRRPGASTAATIPLASPALDQALAARAANRLARVQATAYPAGDGCRRTTRPPGYTQMKVWTKEPLDSVGADATRAGQPAPHRQGDHAPGDGRRQACAQRTHVFDLPNPNAGIRIIRVIGFQSSRA